MSDGSAAPENGGATVLVVDDDPFNRRILVRALQKDGHQTVEAADGVEALKTLALVEPDVMLLDIKMPELDGYGVLTAMKDMPRVSSTPVIMISAVEEQEAVVRCIEMGADDFLPKPADVTILRARVNAGLNKKRLHDLQRQHVRLVFSRFLPEPVVDQVLRDDAVESLLAARRVTGTVMFTDLRRFTTFAEGRPVETVIEVLNRYLSEISDAVLDAGGTLVAYLGDGVMSVFGAPVESDNHADRALAAARQIIGPRRESFNAWLVERGIDATFDIGVGLNSGPLMSGNVGSARRLEYAAIGDTTNTAARVESLTKEVGVPLLLTQAVVDALHAGPDGLRFVDELAPRGREGTVRLWTLA